jgi:hypothetical protein
MRETSDINYEIKGLNSTIIIHVYNKTDSTRSIRKHNHPSFSFYYPLKKP